MPNWVKYLFLGLMLTLSFHACCSLRAMAIAQYEQAVSTERVAIELGKLNQLRKIEVVLETK